MWQWLQQTYWYVPAEYLMALQFNSGESDPFEWVSDQTLWHIEGYRAGYLMGKVYLRLRSHLAEPTYDYRTLVGSVTPEGNVYLSFVPDSTVAAAMATTGVGRMRDRDGEWVFEMQMATGVTALIVHWAWMKQCRPGDEAWERLPGTDCSVPEFMALCVTASS